MAMPEEDGESEGSDSDNDIMSSMQSKGVNRRNSSNLPQEKRSKNTSSMRTRLDPPDNSNTLRQRDDIYLKGYRRARKLFKFLLNQTAQYR